MLGSSLGYRKALRELAARGFAESPGIFPASDWRNALHVTTTAGRALGIFASML